MRAPKVSGYPLYLFDFWSVSATACQELPAVALPVGSHYTQKSKRMPLLSLAQRRGMANA